MTTTPRLALLVAALLLAAGCTREAAATPEPTRPTRSEPAMSTLPPTDHPVTGEVPSEILAAVVADAAARTDAAEDAISVVAAMQMTFSDGSLDCPEPGMLYTQALVDGYHVILDAAGEELDYRITADGGFRLCESGGPPSGG